MVLFATIVGPLGAFEMDTNRGNDDLRAWLTRRLGRDVPEPLWAFLAEEGYLADVEVTDDRQTLYEVARKQLKLSRDIESWKPVDSNEPPDVRSSYSARLTTYELAKGKAFGIYLANVVRRSKDWAGFHEVVLNGQSLSMEDAARFLSSPAVQMFPIEKFLGDGVPMINHSVRLLEEDFTPDGIYTAHLLLEPGDVTWIFSFNYHFQVRSQSIWGKGFPKATETVRLRDEKGGPQDYTYWPNSLLGAVVNLGKSLAPRVLWKYEEVVWFLLTGLLPGAHIALGYAQSNAIPAVTIELEPWVSARTVVELYRQMQRPSMEGREHRSGARNLIVYRFIEENRQGLQGEKVPWRALMSDWNRDYPNDSYSDVRAFARDYRRAENTLRAEFEARSWNR